MRRELSRRVNRRHVAVVLLMAMVAGFGPFVAIQPVGAVDGDVGGVVYRDYNANGAQDTNEIGQADVVVNVYDAADSLVGTGSTAFDGTFTVSVVGAATNAVRVEFVVPQAFLEHGASASAANSSVQFVDIGDLGLSFGVNQPTDYCQADPFIATPCYLQSQAPDHETGDVLVSFPYSAGQEEPGATDPGALNPTPTHLASESELGSTYGVAWDRNTNTVYSAAFQKRHADYGPGGPDAIYQVEVNPATGALVGLPSIFLELDTLFGANTAGDESLLHDPTDWFHDPPAFDAVGKAAFGDIELNSDGSELFAVNLFDRNIYRIPLDDTASTSRYSAPEAACAGGADDSRPFALAEHDGSMYVGVTCTGQTNADETEMSGHVFAFDPQAPSPTFTEVLSWPILSAEHDRGWDPWADVWAELNPSGDRTDAYQPWLTDIEFDGNEMILGIRDRTGDQVGRNAGSPDPADSVQWSNRSRGDILRACAVSPTQWLMENNAASEAACLVPFSSIGANNPVGDDEGPGGGSFYHQDDEELSDTGGHNEHGIGSLAMIPGFDHVVMTNYDPYEGARNEGGIAWLDNNDGTRHRAYTVFETNDDMGNVGKANGLGDIEALCEAAPAELGERVWFDRDGDGIQDPGEEPIPGVVVRILSSDASIDLTATTDIDGRYLFKSAGTSAGTHETVGLALLDDLPPGATYTITFDPSGADVSGIPDVSDPADLEITTGADAINDQHDSDIVDSGGVAEIASVVPPTAGGNDHSLDAGFTASSDEFDLALIKTVTPGQGTIHDGWTAVSFDIVVQNQGDIDATSVVVTDYVPAGLVIDTAATNAANAANTNVTYNDDDTFTIAALDSGSTDTFSVVLTTPDGGTFASHDITAILNGAEISDDNAGATPDRDSTPDNDDGNDPIFQPPNSHNDIGHTGAAYDEPAEDQDDHDRERISLAAGPAIELKKYVQAAPATPFDNADDATLGADAQDPANAVTIPFDGDAVYRITVTNTGGLPLGQITVNDDLPECSSLVRINDGDADVDDILDVGERWTYECTVPNVTADIANTADVTAEPREISVPTVATGDPNVTDDDPAHVTPSTSPTPSIELKKYVQAAPAVAYDSGDDSTLGLDAQDAASALVLPSGSDATYRITTRNTGELPLGSVVVSDGLASCVSLTRIDDGDADANDILAIGERWVFECTITNVDTAVVNTAAVTAEPRLVADPTTPSGDPDVSDSDPANALPVSIELKKYVQAGPAVAFDDADDATLGADAQDPVDSVAIPFDGDAVYRLTARNTGQVPLGDVVVDDHLADCGGLTRIHAGDGDANDILGIDERWVYECSVANVTIDIANTADVTAEPRRIDDPTTATGDPDVTDDDPAHVSSAEPFPAVELKKYVQAAPAAAYDAGDDGTLGADAQDSATAVPIATGTDAVYRIAVTNTGDTALVNVVVDDHVASCALARIDAGDEDPNDVMAPGERWVYECTLANVTADVTNTADVTADPADPNDHTSILGGPVTDDDPANIVATSDPIPAIELKKYVQPAPAISYDAGDDATLGSDAQNPGAAVQISSGNDAVYRITVLNAGELPLGDVVVDDQLPACGVLARIDAGDADGGDILAIGERWVYECTVSAVTGDITNTADVTAEPRLVADPTTASGDPDVSDSDPAHIVAVANPNPSILLKKYVQAGPPVAYDPTVDTTLGNDAQDAGSAVEIVDGGTAVYRITVFNSGDQPLGNVTVDDHLAVCGTLSRIDDGTIVPDNGDADTTTITDDSDTVLDIGERWTYECTVASVDSAMVNTADVTAVPVDPAAPTTGIGPPVTSDDPATTSLASPTVPSVLLKKYAASPAASYDPTDDATLGIDAQTLVDAVSVTAGSDVVYRITVFNNGDVPLGDIDVDDDLASCAVLARIDDGTIVPDNGDADTTTIADDSDTVLDIGERWTYQCAVSGVTATVVNTATVTAEPRDPADPTTPTGDTPVSDDDPANVVVTVDPTPSITLTKYVQAGPAVAYDSGDDTTLGDDAQTTADAVAISSGASAVFRIRVTNSGQLPLGDVSVDDQIAACSDLTRIDSGDADADDILAVGERWTFECTVDAVATPLANVATVSATPRTVADPSVPSGHPSVSDDDPAHTGVAAISLKKYAQAAPATPYVAGDDQSLGLDAQTAGAAVPVGPDGAVFRLVAENTGTVPLGNVAVNDNLAACTTLAQIDSGADDEVLLPGERLVFECVAADITSLTTNVGTATATPVDPAAPTTPVGDPVADDDPANVRPRVVDLSIEKTAGAVNNLARTVDWQLTVRNVGSDPVPGPITVVDDLPSDLGFVSATGDGWNCTSGGQTVTCVRLDGLAAGAAAAPLVLTTSIAADATTVTNNAAVQTISNETVTSNNTDGANTSIPPQLPRTGAESRGLMFWALALITTGVAVTVFGRRWAS